MGTSAEKLNKLKTTKDEIREAINNKGGTLTESNAFSEYATAIDNIQTGGEDTRFKDLVEGTITEINDSSITKIGENAFYSNKVITSVSFPNATSIGSYAFHRCSNLTSVSFPEVTSINERSFQYCNGLTNISFPKVTSFKDYAFADCRNINEIHFSSLININAIGVFMGLSNLEVIDIPNLNYIYKKDTFAECSKLKSISFPLLLNSGEYLCYNCTSLESVDLPLVTKLNISTFYGCSNLISVNTPKVERVDAWVFQNCSSLSKLDLPLLNSINTAAFSGCTSLISLIIRNENAVATLSSTNVFNNTPIATSTDTGFIYVPDSLVDSYKTATNWSTYASKIKPLSFENGSHISNLLINNSKLSLTTPRNAVIYLDGFTNTPDININVSNESIAQVNNITTTTEKITFEVIALGEDGNATITVNVSGDYSKTLTIEVSYTGPMKHRVEQIGEAAYGFTLNSNGYYESTNKGIANSYSLCKLVFNATEMNNILKLECINSGESNYDFGILSNIDTTLSLGSSADSTNVYKSFNGQSSTSPVTITYPEATAGEHYIYIKYKKDGSQDNGNDSLQFRVTA